MAKWNIDIELVAEHDDDKRLAALYKYNTTSLHDHDNNDLEDENQRLARKRKRIEHESIFDAATPPSKPGSSAALSVSPSVALLSVPTPSTTKEAKLGDLKRLLSKSAQQRRMADFKLSGFSTSVKNASSKGEEEEKKGLVLVKFLEKKTIKEQEEKKVAGEKSSLVNSALVSNDYGTDDDGEG